MKTKAFRAALPYTLPICVGFLFLGMSYGFFMRSQGFSFVYPLLMSLFIFAGSMEFVTANLLLLPTFQPVHAFLLTIMVNARHLFYGLSLLDKFKNLGWKKPYLIFGLCDETFSIHCTVGGGPRLVHVLRDRSQPGLLGGRRHGGGLAGLHHPLQHQGH